MPLVLKDIIDKLTVKLEFYDNCYNGYSLDDKVLVDGSVKTIVVLTNAFVICDDGECYLYSDLTKTKAIRLLYDK